jgi:RHS repeat-associated protein
VVTLNATGGTSGGCEVFETVRYSSYGVPFAVPPGDLDGDGAVDNDDGDAILDLQINGPYTLRADLNLDGVIDGGDVSVTLANLGRTLGRGVLSHPSVGNRRGYSGGEHDGVIEELIHLRRRAFRADLGRFLQRDPAGYVDGMSLYEYVSGNPLIYTDPMGLEKQGPPGCIVYGQHGCGPGGGPDPFAPVEGTDGGGGPVPPGTGGGAADPPGTQDAPETSHVPDAEDSCPAHNCPPGTKLRHRPFHQPSSNGCGSGFLSRQLTKASSFRDDFTECCNAHDRCYDTCGASRTKCDVDMMLCARQKCISKYTGKKRAKCIRDAGLFHQAVRTRGRDAYCKAQKKACVCR